MDRTSSPTLIQKKSTTREDDFCAAARSFPAACGFTRDAYTIDAMPVGQKHTSASIANIQCDDAPVVRGA